MHAEFTVILAEPSKDGIDGIAKREVELAFAPTMETEFSFGVWNDPQKPKSVFYDVDDQTFYVRFGLHEANVVDIRTLIDVYRSSGWNVQA